MSEEVIPLGEQDSKLLILGGSNCQVNAFHRANERGIPTVLFDYLPHPPAAGLGTQHVRVSTFDIEGCLEAARRLPLCGVMTLGTDQPVYTAAVLASKLGLPHLIDTETALAVTNKGRMKALLDSAGIPTPAWRLVGGEEELAALPFTGPVVIKPQDSQGQKGVYRCNTVTEAAALFEACRAYSRLGAIVCEEFYESDEITVSAWVQQGHARVLTVTDRLHLPDACHIGICAAHRYPSLAAEGLEGEIDQLTQRLAKTFGIQNGPLYVQLLRGARGLLVNELACRIGGAFEDVFIPHITGFGILDAVMDAALGRPVSAPPAFWPEDRQARVLFPFAGEGTIAAMPPLAEIAALPGVACAGYNRGPGSRVPPLENAGERLAHAVLLANSKTEMEHYLQGFYGRFYARDAAGRDMLLPAPH